MSFRFLRPPAVVALFLLAGCQDDTRRPTLSVDAARTLQAQFSGRPDARFTPPPRTIGDIAATIERYRPDPAQIEALRRVATAAPPAGASASDLYWFYNERGYAAGQLGLVRQQLADLREAIRIGTEARLNTFRALINLQTAEAFAGNNRRAVELGAQRVEVARAGGQQGQLLNALALQSQFLVALGDQAGAERATAEAERILRGPDLVRWAGYRALLPDWEYQIARAKSEIAASSGRYAEAEEHARAAVAQAERARANVTTIRSFVPDLAPDTFDRLVLVSTSRVGLILLRQGRPVEAEIEYRKVLVESLRLYGRSTPMTAAALVQLATTLSVQARDAEAQQLAEVALAIYRELGIERGSRFVAGARMTLAQAQAARRDRDGALRTLAAARDVFADDPDERFRNVEGRPEFISAHLVAGRAGDVLPLAERLAGTLAQRLGQQHFDTAEARGLFGTALARTGQRDRALQEFRAAIPVLLSASRQTEEEDGGVRSAPVRLILEAYVELLSTLPPGAAGDLDPAAEAFRVADAARARGVQRALAASAARASIPDRELATLVRQEQDARKQIAAQFALLSNILAAPGDQQDAAASRGLRERIDRQRDARGALRAEIERRFPDYAQLIDPRPATIAEVQSQLRPGEAVLALHVGAGRSFVWAVPQRGAARFAAVPLGEAEVARAVAQLRRALDPQATSLGEIPAFDAALAHRLYAQFVAPVADGLAGVRSLLVVPDKALGQLPFSLLLTQPVAAPSEGAGQALFAGHAKLPFLLRQMAITQLPSVAALGTLRRLPAGDANRRPFVGFGDPVFSSLQAQASAPAQGAVQSRGLALQRRSAPQTRSAASADLAQLPRLSDTGDEVRSIAIALKADPAADVFLGAAASEQRVKSFAFADRRVVMFATHGLVPGDLDGLTQPALALAAPAVAGIDDDGLLTLDEILGLKLDADWVVLSACNTAAADGAGAEAVSGLGRAFFYAGTRALLVTNWPVETRSARALTTDLFRRQTEDPRLSRAEAMRQAMLAMIDGPGFVDGGRTLYSYAHPIFWAPFSVVGDPG